MNKSKSFISQFYQDITILIFGNGATFTNRSKRVKLLSLFSPIVLALCLIFYSIIGVILVAAGSSKIVPIDTTLLQEDIAKELLRFHVIANSDDPIDQEIKLEVKEEVIAYLKPYLASATSKSEAMEIIRGQLDTLITLANKVLYNNGFYYTANASLSSTTFPVKIYGDVTLPPGEYDALRIELGKAEGQNWWCIMFPQLCFVDGSYSVVPDESKAQLKYLLTDEEYAAIVSEDVDIVVKFKLVDWIKGLFR